MYRLRFFEINVNLNCESVYDFDFLPSLMDSLCISLTSRSPATLEHLKLNIRFRGYANHFDSNIFYKNLRCADVWRLLDSIATHPTGSRLQRVDIINYFFRYDDDRGEPEEDEVLRAVLDGLPLLRTKGILFVEAAVGEWAEPF
jgi:hypothetical protein